MNVHQLEEHDSELAEKQKVAIHNEVDQEWKKNLQEAKNTAETEKKEAEEKLQEEIRQKDVALKGCQAQLEAVEDAETEEEKAPAEQEQVEVQTLEDQEAAMRNRVNQECEKKLQDVTNEAAEKELVIRKQAEECEKELRVVTDAAAEEERKKAELQKSLEEHEQAAKVRTDRIVGESLRGIPAGSCGVETATMIFRWTWSTDFL